MSSTKILSLSECIKRIDEIESTLKEVKKGLSHYRSQLQKSIERGEDDILKGNVTICETEKY